MTIALALTTIIFIALVYFILKADKVYVHALKLNEEFEKNDLTEEEVEEKIHIAQRTRGWLFFAAGLALAGMLISLYYLLQGTPYEGHMKEWMNLLVRLVHITFGIAWIGASFYFVLLENSLNRKKDLRDELAGNLWAVHGGGFYYIEKYKLAPKIIPRDLHWFKYEAYFTWLSGFILLCVVYYFNAKGFLIDPTVLDITPAQGIAIGIGSLAIGLLIYEVLVRTPLVDNSVLFAIIGFIILTGFAYFYTQVFNSRAAYIHFGALLGTIMAANVFLGIIPAQKALVKAAKKGTPLDPSLAKNAGRRSLHNNYFTLPVLFVMISNHFPSTFGNEYNWAILAGISLSTAIFKHYLNLVEKKQHEFWILPVAVFIMLSLTFVTAPKVSNGKCDKVPFSTVYSIINERCVSCHSSSPTDDVWTSPPNGVVYDTPQDIANLSEKIMQRVVITKNMPQNNKTGMLPEERELIRCWINQGSSIEDTE